MDSKEQLAHDRKIFDHAFPQIVNDLVTEENDAVIGDAVKRLRTVLEYNVSGGKRNRGLSVISSLRHLKGVDELSEEDSHCAVVLGWCVELLQSFFLVADDIMDESEYRRGKLCWYLQEGVGNVAVNDAFSIETCVYCLLKKHIRHKPFYTDILELFHDITWQTCIGQTLDLMTPPGEEFENFTMERYKAIVIQKTGFYSFYLPIALAMYMHGIKDRETHDNAKAILLQMGEYFQIQDDFLDCYGDPSSTGKVGTDIEECKCSWLIVQALPKLSKEQKCFLKENYGKNDLNAVKKVKELYESLNLRQEFAEYEESSYKILLAQIEKGSGNLPKEMFTEFAQRIYKRKK